MTEEMLFELLSKTPIAERDILLDRACEGKPELRKRVEALLKADASSKPVIASADIFEVTTLQPATANFSPGDTAGTVIGPYKLLQKLGEGGMGTVWVAEQEQPVKRRVALKLVKAGMDSAQVLRRFEAERQALAMMDHTNIAKVFDAGTTTTGRPYFVMELVKGVPITKYCDEVHASIQDRLELFIQVCSAIQHAHQKGVIHRDIKPSNVLIAMQDGKPVPKVIDFGVAKALHTKLADKTMYTEIGQIIGTLEYMSPEQAELSAMDIDTRADIYALGVLLYELLTGSTPITREQIRSAAFVEVIRLIKEEEPQRPSTRLSESKETLASLAALRRTDPKKLSSTMRGELDWVVMKALEKDRTRRYETANGLARDIQRYLADEVVEARPPTAGYRLKKFVRRNVGKVIAAALILGALLFGFVGTTWGLIRANAATEGERVAKEQAQAEKKKAIEFRDKALDALRATTGEDVEKLIGAKPQLSATERAYLEAIAKRWQVFARTEGTDEQSRSIQAEGHFRLAGLWEHLGLTMEARSEYVQAMSIWANLSAEFPSNPEYREELASNYNNMGLVLSNEGKQTEAEVEYRKAIAIQEKLVDEFLAVPGYRKNLASSYHNFANLQSASGKRMVAQEVHRKAMAIREKLVSEFPALPNYREDLAKGHNDLGLLLGEVGKPAQAEEYRKAIAIQEKLVDEFPLVPAYRQELTNSYHNLGNQLSEVGKQDEAEGEYRKAMVIRERLVGEFPAIPQYRQDLAKVHYALGSLLENVGKRDEAEEEHRKGMSIFEKLVGEFPKIPGYREELAHSYHNLGSRLRDMGKRSEAEGEYRKAIAIREKLVGEFPSVSGYGVNLGASYCNVGNLVLNGGKPADSVEWYAKTIRTLDPIYQRDPRDTEAKLFLRNSYGNRAIAHHQMRKYVEAVKDWNMAIKLSLPAEQPRYRVARANSQLQAGQLTEPIADIAELTSPVDNAAGLAKWNADQWYHFACVYAVASGKIADKRDEYARRCIELLQNAVKAGYNNVAHMKKDTDLDPLRSREDFKKLMAELEKLPKSDSIKK